METTEGRKDIREQAAEILRACPEWYHSIELAPGIETPGRAPHSEWKRRLGALRLPDLRGKSVLDIGAYDGYYSFAAEQLGATRVVALDHYVWSADMAGYMADWRETRRNGGELPPPHQSRHWRPAELPGRKPFDSVRALLGSRVEPVVGDFMVDDLSALGQFDVVLFLGVLYHMEEPLRAMKQVASFVAPGGMAVVETEAVEIPGLENVAVCEFFPGRELNNDPTNWWSPNSKALEGLCSAAGLPRFSMVTEPPRSPWRRLHKRLAAAVRHLLNETHVPAKLGMGASGKGELPRLRYRAIAHAAR